MNRVREAGVVKSGLRPGYESAVLPRRDYRAGCTELLGGSLEM